MRGSVFRAGYELFYTPLAATTKRSAKSIIDVVADSVGKGAGAAVILMVTALVPRYALAAVNVASVFAAGMEFLRCAPTQIRLRERARGRTEAPG